jgi:hypothetical protein
MGTGKDHIAQPEVADIVGKLGHPVGVFARHYKAIERTNVGGLQALRLRQHLSWRTSGKCAAKVEVE